MARIDQLTRAAQTALEAMTDHLESESLASVNIRIRLKKPGDSVGEVTVQPEYHLRIAASGLRVVD